MTQIFEKFISWLHGHPNTISNKIPGNSTVKCFVTKIHRESHSCINVHTSNVPHDLAFFNMNFHANALLVKLPNTSTRGFFICVMDHSRLLPGGPSSSEGPTVATKVLPSC